MRLHVESLVRASVGVVMLLAMMGLTVAPTSAQDAEWVTVIDEDFAEDVGVFRLSRVTVETDVHVADGTLSLTGHRDGEVRTLDGSFGVPLPGRVTIAARMRADEEAYGGLYIFGGNRVVIQLGLGQGPNREGLMVEIDNSDRELRQVSYPDIGTKEQWRDYLVEVDGDQVTVTVDGRQVVDTTFSGRDLDRVSIWNGMNSLGAVEIDDISVGWRPDVAHPAVASFRDEFADAGSLGAWSNTSDVVEWEIVDDEDAENGRALHSDFRHQGRWTLMQPAPITLQPRTQYELRMRLRGLSGQLGVRLSLHQIGQPRPLARIDSRNTIGYADRTATFVTGPDPGVGRLVLEGVMGGGTLWVDRVEIAPADPPLNPYETGVNVLHSTVHEPTQWVGLMVETEAAAPADRITDEDLDADGRWALVELQMPERVVSDVAVNPWGFSNNTVLKSDSAPDGTPLRLRFPSVIPGRYRAYLGDPKRDLALGDGDGWTRVEAGGEFDLGVIEVDEDFELVVAHMYEDEVNPGPVYLDYVRMLPLPDENRISAQARAVHERLTAAREAGWRRSEATFAPVALTVPERAGIARDNAPVVTGVPFAQGELDAGATLRLEDAAGEPVAFEAEPLAHWPDGSVKWLRLRFRTDVAAGAAAEVVLRPGGQAITRPGEAEAPRAEAIIETHSLRVTLGEGLIERVEVFTVEGGAETVLTGPIAARIAVNEREAEVAAVEISSYRLLERGMLGALVGFEGRLRWDGPEIGVQGRLLIDEGRRAMALEAWLVHRDNAERLALHEAELLLGGTSSASRVTIGLQDGQFVRAFGEGWSAVQRGEGYHVAGFEGVATVQDASGAVAWQGERLPGWMLLSGEEGSVAVGVREMTERSPKSLGASADGGGARPAFGIWPAAAGEAFTWNQGVALAHHIGLAFLDADAGGDEAASLLAATMHPLRALATPEHYCASGAFGRVTPRGEGARWQTYEAEVDRAFNLIVNERSAWGMEDFGGVFQPGGYVPGTGRMWTNMEYDFPHATLSQFARTARGEMLERADQATRHFVPIDIIHWTRTERFLGGSRTHSHSLVEGHQVEGPNFGHGGWPQGPLQVYYLTGERQGLDAALLISGYIAHNAAPRPDDTAGRPLYGLREERDAGNAILTSIVTYEATGDPELLEVAYRVLDFVERCQNPDLGNWDTPIYEDPPHRGTTFMQHQLIKGLDAMYEVTGEPRIETIFARHATWLLTEASDGSYRYAQKYSPRFWRGRGLGNFRYYAPGFERAARFSPPEVAERLREHALASMEALFGAPDAHLRNVLLETDTADSAAHTASRARGGAAGQFHDYALTVRGEALTFAVNGSVTHEGSFSGQPARRVRLWSGMRSVGPIEVESFAVERIGPDGEAAAVAEFTFDDPAELARWSALVPEGADSRIEIAGGRLVLVDTDLALIGAELDLPEDLGPDYRIRWRQVMPEGRYGGLMVFGPGEFEFELYNHQPVAILHVGLNQADTTPYSGLFDNPRSFAPSVTYLNELITWLDGG